MNSRERHARVTELFLEALDRPSNERASWLASVCGDADILKEVQAMLSQQAGLEDGLLDRPLLHRTNELTDPMLGRRVGPWQIEGRLGEGGMGVVYSADRADGLYKRTVALKLLRPGANTKDLAGRLAAERSILARLEHAGIARLYDGGITEEGLPYLAIERVDGDPITSWANKHTLATEDRIQLFLQICDAVTYAHRSLVVHRDLKPSNILVTLDASGKPHVKLLDFGIAKLMEEDDSSRLTRTVVGAMTPSYAAPEQIRREPVTTATDVYALGVILYELLTGARPYELATMTAADVERTVCATVPPKPSSRTDAALSRVLSGDLDQIILKALAKEPERRYASADALAEDLQRHLAGQPVTAQPDSLGYRTSKFIRRHRIGVVTALAVFILLAATIGFYTYRLSQQRNVAEGAAHLAESEAARSSAVAGFLEQILRAPNSRWYNESEATGPDTPIRAVLDEAAARVERDFQDQPELRADLHHILGDTYLSLGLSEESGRHHRAALVLRESLYAPPHPKLAEALYYGGGYSNGTTYDFIAEVRALRRAVSMLRARNEGNNFPFMLQTLGSRYLMAGRPEDAIPLLEEGLDFVVRTFVEGHDGFRYRDPIQTGLAQSISTAYLDLARLDKAAEWIAFADSVFEILPRETRFQAPWQNQMCARGRLEMLSGDFVQAERSLLACAGDSSELAISSPFGDGPSTTPSDAACSLLVELYTRWERPEDATLCLTQAHRRKALADSLRLRLVESGVLDEPVESW